MLCGKDPSHWPAQHGLLGALKEGWDGKADGTALHSDSPWGHCASLAQEFGLAMDPLRHRLPSTICR